MKAFLFSGQGAQKVGMGKELCDNFSAAADVFDKASSTLGMDMRQLIFDSDEQTLQITENTQPAILTMSIAALRILEQHGVSPDMVAGLSLGEYSAHVCAGTFAFEDAVRIVRKRGKFMQECVPIGEGTMAAILGLDGDAVAKVCQEANSFGVVSPANYNCPGQITISGAVAAVNAACVIAKERGAKRAMILPVSAPFHCKMLEPAGQMLAPLLGTVNYSEMKVPVVSNVTALEVENFGAVRDLLVSQVSMPVLFEQSVRHMIARGVDTFVEIGPGKTLCGFVKKIDAGVAVYNVEDGASLEQCLAGLGGRA